MCGFYGQIRKNELEESDITIIEKSVKDKLFTRGPDNFSLEKLNNKIIFGHSRLAIHDTSNHGNQPFSRGCQTLIFNGEIYNYKDLKTEICEHDSSTIFDSQSDTEVLFLYLSIFGIERTLKNIEGMFSFCFLDLSLSVCYFAVDRFGQKPLYYFNSGEGFEFGSFPFNELDVNSRELNIDGVAEYFRTGCFPEENTVLNGVERLLAGSYLQLDLNSFLLSNSNYTKRVYEINKIKEINENPLRHWEILFEQIIDEYIDADVPVAVLVSGGVDSACLMVALSKLNKKVVCLTAETGGALSEVVEAKKIAEFLGLEHHVVHLEEDLVEVMRSLAENMPQPLGDPAIIPLASIAQAMNKMGIKVGLLGDGGDEMFNGYTSHYEASLNSKKFINIDEKYFKAILAITPNVYRQAIAFKVFGLMYSSFQSDYVFHCRRTMGLVAKPLYLKELTGNDWSSLSKNKQYKGSLQESEYEYRIPNRFAPKLDVSGMSQSVEFRVPFLDSRLVNFTFSNKLNNRETQINYLSKHLPSEFLTKQKKGLGLDLSKMFKDELKPWIDGIASKINLGIYNELNYLFNFKEVLHMISVNRVKSHHTKELYPLFIFLDWWEQNKK
jgi:asparagine synthase (glutamine-hydrolysing)